MILAGPIQSFRKRNVFAKVVFGRVFKTIQKQIVVVAVKVQPLMPCDFAAIAEVCQAELRVLLVAPAFLTLAGFVDDVMPQLPIARTTHVIVQRALKHRAVIAENADGHHRFEGGGVPIAVGKRCEVLDNWINDFAKMGFRLLNIRRATNWHRYDEEFPPR